MELIGRFDAEPFFGLLPYVAVMLLSIVGYWAVKRGQKVIVDSPWFWVFIFSTVGMVGVWAISRKYDDREKRLETRYEARQQIAERRAQEMKAASSVAQMDENAEARSGYGAERQVPLRFLAGGLFVIAIGSGIMLWRSAMKLGREPSERLDK
jgi:hypothetical protein